MGSDEEARPLRAILVGKYFLDGDQHSGPGVVLAAIDDTHYLVRLDSDGDMPAHMCVVAISDMARAGGTGKDDDAPPWAFFDDITERAKFLAWIDGPSRPPIRLAHHRKPEPPDRTSPPKGVIAS
jgi:hypothetical protein